MNNTEFRGTLFGAMLLAAGMIAGAILTTSSVAWGEVRTSQAPMPFKSGSQLSVPILQDISATLQRIDARLARLETTVQKLAARPDTAGPN